MADITFEDGGGNQRTVPEWATEVTLKQLVDDFSEDMDTVVDKMGNGFERFGDRAGQILGGIIDKTVGVALIALGTAVTIVTSAFVTLGTSLNALSQSGLALEGGTIRQLASLNALGMSTDEATEFMLQNAQAFRTLGNTATNDVIKTFLDITGSGGDLGMSLQDSTELLGAELKLRTQLLNLGALDGAARGQLTAGIRELARDQLNYSKALGVSTDMQREFVETVMQDNRMLMSNMVRISSESRATLTTGVQSFLSGMFAMGGEAGGEIGAAVLEAASMGAVGFSEAAFGFITVLPGLADNMQSVIADFNAGVI